MLTTLSMTGPRAPIQAEPADHPLRAALARGDDALARSGPALHHTLAARDRSLLSEVVVAQVSGLVSDLARQLGHVYGAADRSDGFVEALYDRLLPIDELRVHCQALAFEWRLALRLETELAIDPVLSPQVQTLVAHGDPATGAIAMAALASQARFAQAQRRMELPLGELPAELFHAVLLAMRDAAEGEGTEQAARAEARLRANYVEADSRLSLLARLADATHDAAHPAPAIEDAGVALWLSALAARSGETRDRTACAAADRSLGRLLLTLRAAGVSPGEAERQVLRIQPDAVLPRGLDEIGTREAAQWLAEARA